MPRADSRAATMSLAGHCQEQRLQGLVTDGETGCASCECSAALGGCCLLPRCRAEHSERGISGGCEPSGEQSPPHVSLWAEQQTAHSGWAPTPFPVTARLCSVARLPVLTTSCSATACHILVCLAASWSPACNLESSPTSHLVNS